jgi:hypothetical protein
MTIVQSPGTRTARYWDMANKTRGLWQTRTIQNAFRRNRFGVTALTLGSMALAMSPRLRQRARAMKNQLFDRLGARFKSRGASSSDIASTSSSASVT